MMKFTPRNWCEIISVVALTVQRIILAKADGKAEARIRTRPWIKTLLPTCFRELKRRIFVKKSQEIQPLWIAGVLQ